MKIIRNLLDNLRPHFAKGGKLGMFHALFDATDNFLLSSGELTSGGSHIRSSNNLKRLMFTVMIALVPATLFGIWNIGYQHYMAIGTCPNLWTAFLFGLGKYLPIVVVTYLSGLAVEVTFCQIRGHQVAEGFFVTGMMIPLILPPDIPLWIVAVATIFATLFAKEVFGGTGMNFMNPALVARAFIFFAYPSVISGDKIWIAELPDTVSGATPLATAPLSGVCNLPDPITLFLGLTPGSVGETSVLAILLGAILLICTGVASWKIMLSVTAGGVLTGLAFNLIGQTPYMQVPFYYHLLMGGFAFGAVFMATDPVTASHTKYGKVIVGLLIGTLAIVLRVLNPAYPEGMMLAILIMNVFTPLIDHIVVRCAIRKRKRFLDKQC
ncbi:MAG: NADH:ubiquinone reductase (Na(+)-transporting) subunit B [Bacteroidales bacterium]|nr:NADH:ubiquinone reductase (Na(+)-transporting) subunit B [Bacteroidales bacterium]